MKAQREFTFHMPPKIPPQVSPVLYDVSGLGIAFSAQDASHKVPYFASGVRILSDAKALRIHMFKCGKAAKTANDKHANDHIFYTDGHYIVAHRHMVVLMHPLLFQTENKKALVKELVL